MLPEINLPSELLFFAALIPVLIQVFLKDLTKQLPAWSIRLVSIILCLAAAFLYTAHPWREQLTSGLMLWLVTEGFYKSAKTVAGNAPTP